MSFNLLFCQKCAETSICRLNLLVFHLGRHIWHWSSSVPIQVSFVGLINPSILHTCITAKQGMSQNLSLGNYLIPLSQNMMCAYFFNYFVSHSSWQNWFCFGNILTLKEKKFRKQIRLNENYTQTPTSELPILGSHFKNKPTYPTTEQDVFLPSAQWSGWIYHLGLNTSDARHECTCSAVLVLGKQ